MHSLAKVYTFFCLFVDSCRWKRRFLRPPTAIIIFYNAMWLKWLRSSRPTPKPHWPYVTVIEKREIVLFDVTSSLTAELNRCLASFDGFHLFSFENRWLCVDRISYGFNSIWLKFSPESTGLYSCLIRSLYFRSDQLRIEMKPTFQIECKEVSYHMLY